MIDTVDPQSFEISRSEKYRNVEIIRRVTGDSDRPIPNLLSGTIEVLQAWEDAEISEGQAAKALRMDRLAARTLWTVYSDDHNL